MISSMKSVFLIGIVGLMACCNVEQQQVKIEADTSMNINEKDTIRELVPNETYGSDFLKAWKEFILYQPALLKNNYVIIGADTIAFPIQPIIKQEQHFTASNKNQSFSIEIRRTVLGEIDFYFSVTESGKMVFEKKGTAVLQPGFCLAVESDFDERNEEEYPCNEFYYELGDCFVNIRIEETESTINPRVNVQYSCDKNAGNPNHPIGKSPIMSISK